MDHFPHINVKNTYLEPPPKVYQLVNNPNKITALSAKMFADSNFGLTDSVRFPANRAYDARLLSVIGVAQVLTGDSSWQIFFGLALRHCILHSGITP